MLRLNGNKRRGRRPPQATDALHLGGHGSPRVPGASAGCPAPLLARMPSYPVFFSVRDKVFPTTGNPYREKMSWSRVRLAARLRLRLPWARRAFSSATGRATSFEIGSSARPHPRKKAPPGFVGNFIGEDAYFSEHGRAWAVLGVADGVSGAGEAAREYSKNFMESARKAAKRAAAARPTQMGAPSASALLQGAYVETAGQEGRATVCIAVLETTKTGSYLHAANIGDSGFCVLRVRGEGTGARLSIAQRSRSLSHSFNCPYQLGVLNGVELNTPADADVYSAVELLTGDLVLVATDGLTDILFPLDILTLVAKALGQGRTAEEIAQELVERAIELSRDDHHVSPLVKALAEQGKVARSREAQDDVTVLVARVL